MTRSITFKVFIPEREVASLLDMLRYDGAVVLSWDRTKDARVSWDRTKDARDRDGWLVTMRSDTFTPGRWHSFGLHPEVVI